MSGRPNSFMPMYWGDYWSDTAHLTAAQHGAYLNLIGRYWRSGQPLPDDDSQLWRLALADGPKQWLAMREIILAFFRWDGAVWRHGRIDAELAKAERISATRKRIGAIGGQQKASNALANGIANGIANAKQDVWQKATPSQPQPQSIAEAIDVGADAPRPSKGTRLPADWTLPDDWYEWACQAWPLATGEIAQQAEIFRDYWTAQPGQKGVKTDWPATWRNWIRRCANGGTNGGSRHYRKSGFDVVLDEIRSGANRAVAVDPD